jgi:branched-chain amino acid transport system ATP-binding protein
LRRIGLRGLAWRERSALPRARRHDCRRTSRRGGVPKPHLPRPRPRSDRRAAERVGLAGHDRRPAADLTYIDRKRLELARALRASRACCCSTNGSRASILRTHDRHRPDPVAEGDGITIVLVEHVMNAVRALCDRCVVMSSGRKIAEGAPPTF